MMYYNSNKTNNDYYNTYKQEMTTLEDYHEGFSFQKIIKIGFTILMLGLFSIFTIYLINYFSVDGKEVISKSTNINHTYEKVPPKVVLSEEMLPKSIQIEEKKSDISPKDVALIVKIIIAQINDKKGSSLESQILLSKKQGVNLKTLAESNHYNKIIVSNNKNFEDKQIELKEKLDLLLTEAYPILSGYEQAIQKELETRSNEMRIIIVQRGDTLSKIAKKAYGKFDAYPKILMANPEIVKNPNEIFVGQKLRIPA